MLKCVHVGVLVRAALASLLGCFLSNGALAQRGSGPIDCNAGWLRTGLPTQPSASNALAIEAFNFEVFVGTTGLGVPNFFDPLIQQRSGDQWLPVGGGLAHTDGNNVVSGLASFQPVVGVLPGMLVAVGIFDAAPSEPGLNNIVGWNGTNWIDLYDHPSPIGGPDDAWIRTAVVHDHTSDDSIPPTLWIGGSFNSFQDLGVNRIASFDGAAWQSSTTGLPPDFDFVHRLVSIDLDGPGPEGPRLLALLSVTTNPANCMYIFDDAMQTWSPFGPSAANDESNEIVFDAVAFDPDGPEGPEPTSVYAAGTVFGANRVARYDAMSNSWSGLPGAPGGIFANSGTYFVSLASYDDFAFLGQRALVMGIGFPTFGGPTETMYSWNGFSYSAITIPGMRRARDMRVLQTWTDRRVYIAGQNNVDKGEAAAAAYDGLNPRLAAYSDSDQFALANDSVTAVAAWNGFDSNPSAPDRLVVATRGESNSQHSPFLLWDGSAFSSFPGGDFFNAFGQPVEINEMAAYDVDGPGPAAPKLAVAGAFDQIFGDPALGVAIWNGSSWQRIVDVGSRPDVRALVQVEAPFAPPNAPALIAAGSFSSINGVAANNVAIWNGSIWAPVGTGVNGVVNDAVFWDADGPSSGDFQPVLYIAGAFTLPGSSQVTSFARWNGSQFETPPGAEADGVVNRLLPWHRFGTEESQLVVAGEFVYSDGKSNAEEVFAYDGFAPQLLGVFSSGEMVMDLATLDVDGPGGAPERLHAIFRNLAGIREFRVLDPGLFWLTPSGGEFGPPFGSAHTALQTIDLDNDGAESDCIVIAGDLPPVLGFEPTSGLARYTAAQPGLIVVPNGPEIGEAGAYACLGAPPVSEPRLWDWERVLGDAWADTTANLDASRNFASLSLFSGRVTFNLSSANVNPVVLNLTADPRYADALLVDGETAGLTYLTFTNVLGTPASIINAGRVTIGEHFRNNFVNQTVNVFDHVTLDVSDDLRIGHGSFGGTMVVAGNGATLSTSKDVLLGTQPGTTGELFIYPGASWLSPPSTNNLLQIAGSGNANIDIDGSSVMLNFQTIVMGVGPFSGGRLEIGESLPSSVIVDGLTLTVGDSGNATFVVRNGSQVQLDVPLLTLAAEQFSSGEVSVFSPGTRLDLLSTNVVVGESGAGAFVVAQGARVDANGFNHTLLLGSNPGASGRLRIHGEGVAPASWFGGGATELTAGLAGNGSALIEVGEGCLLEVATFTLGQNGRLEGAGTVSVTGFGARGGAPTLFNRGSINPRGDGTLVGVEVPGTLSIEGRYEQLSAPDNNGIPGRLIIDVAGADFNQHDAIDVNGPVELGGRLDVRFLPGFNAAPGALASGINIISTLDSITGRFDVANFPGLASSPTGEPRFLRFETRLGPRGAFSVVVVEDTLPTQPPASAPAQGFETGGVGADADLGDLNLDGINDVAITIPDPANPATAPGSIVILFNGGAPGGFWAGFTSSVQLTVPANPASIVIADFDGVLGNDIAFSTLSDSSVHVLLNDGSGGFSFVRGDVPPVTVIGDPVHLIRSDFNLSGATDVAVITTGSPSMTLLLNSRDVAGGFMGLVETQRVPIPPPTNTGVAADIDNDKWDEIVVPDEEGDTISVIDNNGPDFLQRGALIFNPAAVSVFVPGDPQDVESADLNLDGFVDAVISTKSNNSLTILLGDGTNDFLPPLAVPAGSEPDDLTIADLDLDNDPDLAVITSNNSDQRVLRVIRNDLFGGILGFANQGDLFPDAPPSIVLSGDLTEDGNDDLLTVNDAGGVRSFGGGPARGVAEGDDVTVFTFRACTGDATNDRVVDMADISAVLTNWLAEYAPGTGPGDANGDGVVTFADLTAVLSSFGRSCE